MTVMDRLSAGWQDVLNLVLGVGLLFAPGLLGFDAQQSAASNAHIVGAIIAVTALAALFLFQAWEEWLSGALGVWLIAAPWVLGFSGQTTATYTHVLIGIATFVLAMWSANEHSSGHMPAGR